MSNDASRFWALLYGVVASTFCGRSGYSAVPGVLFWSGFVDLRPSGFALTETGILGVQVVSLGFRCCYEDIVSARVEGDSSNQLDFVEELKASDVMARQAAGQVAFRGMIR